MALSNKSTGLSLLAIVLGMAMLAYASVPLYRLFCQVTGFGGTTQASDFFPDEVLDRKIKVQFNADTIKGLPWDFKPSQRSVTVNIGESGLAFYEAKNLSKEQTIGTSTFNVVPHRAGQYFVKVECFCFQEQPLAGEEEVDMPVSFYIDPAIADDRELSDIETITLSYTFFPVEK